jgi:hypothetical protein
MVSGGSEYGPSVQNLEKFPNKDISTTENVNWFFLSENVLNGWPLTSTIQASQQKVDWKSFQIRLNIKMKWFRDHVLTCSYIRDLDCSSSRQTKCYYWQTKCY